MRDAVVLAGGVLALCLAVGCAEGTGIDGSPVDPDPVGTTSDGNPSETGTTTGIFATSTDDGSTSSSGSSDDSADTSADSSSGSGTAGSTCGNGMLDDDEPCDGDQLGGVTCPDIDPRFTGGAPTCSSECTIETTSCISAANPYTHCIDVGQTIPDGSASGLTSSWTIPDGLAPGQVADVNVRVELVHPYVGDLVIDLVHGDTSVRVFDRRCTSGDDLVATFDDEAGGAIACLMTDVDATVRPQAPLTAFDGDATQTQWSLFVRDAVVADVGTLAQWCITVQWTNP